MSESKYLDGKLFSFSPYQNCPLPCHFSFPSPFLPFSSSPRIIILIDLSVLTSAAAVGSAIGHPDLLELVRAGSNAPAPNATNQSSTLPNNGRGNQMGGGMGYGGGRGGQAQQNSVNRSGRSYFHVLYVAMITSSFYLLF